MTKEQVSSWWAADLKRNLIEFLEIDIIIKIRHITIKLSRQLNSRVNESELRIQFELEERFEESTQIQSGDIKEVKLKDREED